MRVAVAGSTGLIGHAIAAALAARGHEVIRLGRAPGSDAHVDLDRPETISSPALARCEALVHAAGVTDEDFADPARAEAKATRGAAALIMAASAAGVRRLAYVSSAHIYGPLEGRIDERSPARPASPYARAHLETEALFRGAQGGGVAVLLLRPCAVYGMPPSLARFARWSLIPFDFPRQAIGGRIVLKSAGLQRRNFVSAAGLARLAGDWIGGGEEGTTVANAPGPHEMAVYDFAASCARIAAEETGRSCAIERPGDAGPVRASLEYATVLGGPLPGPSLEDHVRDLVRALAK